MRTNREHYLESRKSPLEKGWKEGHINTCQYKGLTKLNDISLFNFRRHGKPVQRILGQAIALIFCFCVQY